MTILVHYKTPAIDNRKNISRITVTLYVTVETEFIDNDDDEFLFNYDINCSNDNGPWIQFVKLDTNNFNRPFRIKQKTKDQILGYNG